VDRVVTQVLGAAEIIHTSKVLTKQQLCYTMQVSAELEETKLWAQSHIADNCCFHYRRVSVEAIL